MLQTFRFSLFAIVLQLCFIILFMVFVRYPELGVPLTDVEFNVSNSSSEVHGAAAKLEVGQSYSSFQDVHVMIFVGFGFLMTFLKRYGFSSVGLNMLVSALALQWGILTAGWILHLKDGVIRVGISDIIGAEFAAAVVLISFGAVLGKVSAIQLLVMALIEVVLFQVNQLIVVNKLEAADIGGSLVIHLFGAYFGLAVSRVLHKAGDVHKAEPMAKESSVYHSDIFAMIGTIFLWMFWPSFNSALAAGEGQYRAVINTYFALAACAVVTFSLSALAHKGKFDMVHIQNATLAGGVAVGTMADMIIQPHGALLVGALAAVVSVIGYRFITPLLASRFGIHDTCGVHNLHGMPGVFSGLGGIICAAMATTELYGQTLTDHFPARDVISAGQQAGHQAAAIVVSLAMSIIGGLLTGLLLRLPIWQQPTDKQLFDDAGYWTLPDEGFPTASVNVDVGEHRNVDMNMNDNRQADGDSDSSTHSV